MPGPFLFVSGDVAGNDSTAIGLNPVGAGSCVMRRSDRSPSIVPPGNDQDVYLVRDDFGGRIGSAWRENQFPAPILVLTRGNGMGYLKLVILVLAYALIPPAYAQTCCPAGCAPEVDRCVTTGPLWTRCIPIACADGSRKPSGDSAAGPTREHRKSAVLARPLRTARTYVAPRQIPPECPLMNPTKAQADEATHQCVKALTGSAQLWGRCVEDDAGS